MNIPNVGAESMGEMYEKCTSCIPVKKWKFFIKYPKFLDHCHSRACVNHQFYVWLVKRNFSSKDHSTRFRKYHVYQSHVNDIKWYKVKFFKGCFPQILLGPFLNTLSQMINVLNLFQPNTAFQIATSHLICRANQMTGFCMKRNTGLKWVNPFAPNVYLSILKKNTIF